MLCDALWLLVVIVMLYTAITFVTVLCDAIAVLCDDVTVVCDARLITIYFSSISAFLCFATRSGERRLRFLARGRHFGVEFEAVGASFLAGRNGETGSGNFLL
jgi:hypothetical protein